MHDLEPKFTQAPQPVRDSIADLRTLLLSCSSDLFEKDQPGWGGLGYHHKNAGYICGIFPDERHVKLNFEWGRLLTDPEQQLQGNGKQCRHLLLSPAQALPEALIRSLVAEAIALKHHYAPR